MVKTFEQKYKKTKIIVGICTRARVYVSMMRYMNDYSQDTVWLQHSGMSLGVVFFRQPSCYSCYSVHTAPQVSKNTLVYILKLHCSFLSLRFTCVFTSKSRSNRVRDKIEREDQRSIDPKKAQPPRNIDFPDAKNFN